MSQELCESVLALAICLEHPYGNIKPHEASHLSTAPSGRGAGVPAKDPWGSVGTPLEPLGQEESSSSL